MVSAGGLFERFALQLMTLLRMILDCEDYKVSTVKNMPTGKIVHTVDTVYKLTFL